MKPISKLQQYLELIADPTDPTLSISGELLELIKDTLPTFDEFKGVKKINLVPMPCFLVDKDTEEPRTFDEDCVVSQKTSFLDETNTKAITVESYRLADGECRFNEEIDLYSISLTPVIYDPEDVEEMQNSLGAFRTPVLYDPNTATPKEKITITWSKWDMMDEMKNIESDRQDLIIKEHVMKMFEDAYDGKTGLPKRRGIIVRISPRSHKQKEVASE